MTITPMDAIGLEAGVTRHVPESGQIVLGIAGHLVGVVQRVTPDSFLVRTRAGDERWLSASAIFRSEARRLHLVCHPDGIWRYELPSGPDGLTPPPM